MAEVTHNPSETSFRAVGEEHAFTFKESSKEVSYTEARQEWLLVSNAAGSNVSIYYTDKKMDPTVLSNPNVIAWKTVGDYLFLFNGQEVEAMNIMTKIRKSVKISVGEAECTRKKSIAITGNKQSLCLITASHIYTWKRDTNGYLIADSCEEMPKETLHNLLQAQCQLVLGILFIGSENGFQLVNLKTSQILHVKHESSYSLRHLRWFQDRVAGVDDAFVYLWVVDNSDVKSYNASTPEYVTALYLDSSKIVTGDISGCLVSYSAFDASPLFPLNLPKKEDSSGSMSSKVEGRINDIFSVGGSILVAAHHDGYFAAWDMTCVRSSCSSSVSAGKKGEHPFLLRPTSLDPTTFVAVSVKAEQTEKIVIHTTYSLTTPFESHVKITPATSLYLYYNENSSLTVNSPPPTPIAATTSIASVSSLFASSNSNAITPNPTPPPAPAPQPAVSELPLSKEFTFEGILSMVDWMQKQIQQNVCTMLLFMPADYAIQHGHASDQVYLERLSRIKEQMDTLNMKVFIIVSGPAAEIPIVRYEAKVPKKEKSKKKKMSSSSSTNQLVSPSVASELSRNGSMTERDGDKKDKKSKDTMKIPHPFEVIIDRHSDIAAALGVPIVAESRAIRLFEMRVFYKNSMPIQVWKPGKGIQKYWKPYPSALMYVLDLMLAILGSPDKKASDATITSNDHIVSTWQAKVWQQADLSVLLSAG